MQIANFANEGHSGFPCHSTNLSIMSILIAIICLFAWIVPALKDGSNIK